MSRSSDDGPECGKPRGPRGLDPELLQVLLQFAELVARIVLALHGNGPGW